MIERRVTDCLEHIVDFGDVLKNYMVSLVGNRLIETIGAWQLVDPKKRAGGRYTVYSCTSHKSIYTLPDLNRNPDQTNNSSLSAVFLQPFGLTPILPAAHPKIPKPHPFGNNMKRSHVQVLSGIVLISLWLFYLALSIWKIKSQTTDIGTQVGQK